MTTQIQTHDVEGLDKYAGAVAKIEGKKITDANKELEVGDLVCATRGKGPQGVVTEVMESGRIEFMRPSGGITTSRFSRVRDGDAWFTMIGGDMEFRMVLLEKDFVDVADESDDAEATDHGIEAGDEVSAKDEYGETINGIVSDVHDSGNLSVDTGAHTVTVDADTAIVTGWPNE